MFPAMGSSGSDGRDALIDYAADQAAGTATFTVTGIARGTEVSAICLLASAGQLADLVGDPLKLGRSPDMILRACPVMLAGDHSHHAVRKKPLDLGIVEATTDDPRRVPGHHGVWRNVGGDHAGRRHHSTVPDHS